MCAITWGCLRTLASSIPIHASQRKGFDKKAGSKPEVKYMRRSLLLLAVPALLTAQIGSALAVELNTWRQVSIAEAGNVFGADEAAVVWAAKVGAACYVSEASAATPLAKGIVKVLQCFKPGYTGDNPHIEDYTTAHFTKTN